MGRVMLTSGIFLLLVLGVFPTGINLLTYWENRAPLLTDLPKKVDGIIVLGGSVSVRISELRGQVQLNENAPRISEMLVLAKKYPRAKIIFSGGDGNLFHISSSESAELKNLLKNMGFDTSRIIFEDKSRNTFENMEYSRELVKPKTGEKWILVTSAFHMPRSVAIFNSNGWKVIPYPAGYLTEGNYRYWPTLDVLGNIYKLQVAVKEIVGIMAYRLTGRIKPDDSVQANTIVSSAPAPAGVSTSGKGQ